MDNAPFLMSTETDKLFSSLVKALPEIPTVPLNGKAQFGNHKLIDDILDAVKPVLKQFDLAIIPSPIDDSWLTVVIIHTSGQFMRFSMKFPEKDTNNRQTNQHARGGDITYFRRYMLESILGIAGDVDTDGHYPKQNNVPITKAELEKLLEVLATKDNYAAIVADVLRIEKIKDLNQLNKSAYEELLESLK